MSNIISTGLQRLSSWVELNTKSVDWGDERGVQIYHSLELADYVSIFAVTVDGMVPLVRQFRPGCGEYTLELPGGMLESDEDPKNCARRELFEETGLESGEIEFLGTLWPDPGRLGNRLHCFHITGARTLCSKDWHPEAGLSLEFIPLDQLWRLAASGGLQNSHHLAVLGLYLAQSKLGDFSYQSDI